MDSLALIELGMCRRLRLEGQSVSCSYSSGQVSMFSIRTGLAFSRTVPADNFGDQSALAGSVVDDNIAFLNSSFLVPIAGLVSPSSSAKYG
jgi:hypothetical protein